MKGTRSAPWTHWLKCPFIQYEEEKFLDIEGHWAKDKIMRAVELGLMPSDGDSTFDTDKPVTRAQLAVASVNIYDVLLKG